MGSYPVRGVTFVTALYLPAGPMFKPVDTYFANFEQLAGTGIPLILYLDTRLRIMRIKINNCNKEKK